MSAKTLGGKVPPMIGRKHIALEGINALEHRPFDHWSGVLATRPNQAGRIALTEWARFRKPCRRADWWPS